jgi:hypothetical protein
VHDRCSALASLVARSLSGEPAHLDVSGLAARVAERAGDGGLYRCRLCGRTVRLSHLKQHLRTRHCGELEELWSELKPRRLPRGGKSGGGASYMPFLLYCRACGWGVLLRLPRNRGPPSLRGRLRELVGKAVPATCPNCGRAFDPSKLEPGFAGERELHRRPPGDPATLAHRGHPSTPTHATQSSRTGARPRPQQAGARRPPSSPH